MKRIFILIVGFLSMATIVAGVVDPASRAELRRQSHGLATVQTADSQGKRQARLKHTNAKQTIQPPRLLVITIAEGHEAHELQGLEVLKTIGNRAFCMAPATASLDSIAAMPAVKSVALSTSYLPKLEAARAASGIDKIHSAQGLPQAYTGAGVVAGIVDMGLDPNHINFKNSDGTSRVGYFSTLTINEHATSQDNAIVVREYDASTVGTFKTENAGQFHGTHTMGILAGGYRGDISMAVADDAPDATGALHSHNETHPCPYYGAAAGATIAAACGPLQDAIIATGVDNILSYAYNEQKPSVISLSIGSNDGPHDGTEVMNQFLDLAAKESIIVVSAGNEGDLPVALHKEFSSSDTVMQSFLMPMVYGPTDTVYPNLRYGTVRVYSRDASPLNVQVVVYNKKRGRIAYRMALEGNTQGQSTYYATPGYAQDGDIETAMLAKAVNGYVGLGSMTDDGSGRFMALLDFFIFDNKETNPDGNYLIGITVNGKQGQRADMFTDAQFMAFDNYQQAGWDQGMTDGSISSMACGQDVIVVGSYNTRETWAAMDGGVYGYGDAFPKGAITNFSSYGTLVDGRTLPTVCAPGTTLISSCNYYYYQGSGSPSGMVCALHSEDGRQSPYIQTMGTSMSTPLVAGAIALWLEADPTLTAKDVKEIIQLTAVKDDAVLTTGNPVQWGAGKFDAYAGLQEVLRRKGAGIADISSEASDLLVKPNGPNIYELSIPGASDLRITLYNASGSQVLSLNTNGDTATMDTSHIAHGVYILNVNGISSKIIVK